MNFGTFTRNLIRWNIEWQLQRQLTAQKATLLPQQHPRLILPHNLHPFHCARPAALRSNKPNLPGGGIHANTDHAMARRGAEQPLPQRPGQLQSANGVRIGTFAAHEKRPEDVEPARKQTPDFVCGRHRSTVRSSGPTGMGAWVRKRVRKLACFPGEIGGGAVAVEGA